LNSPDAAVASSFVLSVAVLSAVVLDEAELWLPPHAARPNTIADARRVAKIFFFMLVLLFYAFACDSIFDRLCR
jgi:hypothetical protein